MVKKTDTLLRLKLKSKRLILKSYIIRLKKKEQKSERDHRKKEFKDIEKFLKQK